MPAAAPDVAVKTPDSPPPAVAADAEVDSSVEESTVEDDEDESEPALKYDVLEGETPKLFERDSASALSLSSKYIVGHTLSIILFDLTSSRSSGHTMV